MSAPLHPVGDFIVAIQEEAKTKTASGLYLPDNAQEKSEIITVLGVGPEVKKIKVGDRIVAKTYGTTKIKIEKQDYILVKEEDVLATVK